MDTKLFHISTVSNFTLEPMNGMLQGDQTSLESSRSLAFGVEAALP